MSSPMRSLTDDNFRLPKQPYYSELFSKKELKKLAKAEKFRDQSTEAMVMAAAIKKEASDLRKSSPELTSKIEKQIAKLEAKAIQQELDALKCFEKAADIYRVVYTNELNNKTFSASTISEKTAQNLALEAQNIYQSADNLKDNLTSENTLEVYRGMYSKHMDAIFDQEIAFAIYKGDSQVNYANYLNANRLDTTEAGNIAKENIPTLIAKEHYDFDKDTNIYKIRFHQLEEKLGLSDDDKKAIQKLEADEANSITLFQKAEKLGCSADTFRVYAGEATTLAEKEYYDQKAQENELNECSNLLKAIKLEVGSNNKLYEIYKKYIPNIRDEKNEVGKNYEAQAESLFMLSNTYESMAAKQMSHVEQYTQLSEGNEVKLQAIQNIENAIASYLGQSLSPDKMSLATGASEKHNDIPMDFNMDESDGEPQKVADNNAPSAPAASAGNSNTKPANQVVDSNKPAANSQQQSKSTSGSKTSNSNKPSTSGNKTASNNKGNNSKNNNTKAPSTSNAPKSEKVPVVSSSNAAVVSTSYYTREDQRMKPYSFPAGTIFSVEAGIYKEMPEPVEFPAVDNFLAQNLKGQTYMRYYIGDFKTYDAAYAALAMAQNEGYKKAKVVAFVNGKQSDVMAAKANAEKSANSKQLAQQELKKIHANQKLTISYSAKITARC
ncbi:MAG: hypothetical protein MJZ61_04560, partial [Bacteroidales bacterium]|nr:hypothetical protein [Bacteroidales bacterium]